MSTPYIGEIRIFAGNFAPVDWALCQGQLLPISEYDALFQLIGTTYGGDGQTTFGLPNLQSRIPVHVGPGFALGQTGGAETVTLTVSQIPSHSHVPQAATATNGNQSNSPANNVWSNSTTGSYANVTPSIALAPNALRPAGGSQPHDNMMPYLCINYIISLYGVFPSQT